MIQIKPINILGKEATFLHINVQLQTGGETSTAFYTLKDSEGGYLYDNIIQIPSEVHSLWAEDDSVIEDYVLETLNLKRL
jgi:hypothetical protein